MFSPGKYIVTIMHYGDTNKVRIQRWHPRVTKEPRLWLAYGGRLPKCIALNLNHGDSHYRTKTHNIIRLSGNDARDRGIAMVEEAKHTAEHTELHYMVLCTSNPKHQSWDFSDVLRKENRHRFLSAWINPENLIINR